MNVVVPCHRPSLQCLDPIQRPNQIAVIAILADDAFPVKDVCVWTELGIVGLVVVTVRAAFIMLSTEEGIMRSSSGNVGDLDSDRHVLIDKGVGPREHKLLLCHATNLARLQLVVVDSFMMMLLGGMSPNDQTESFINSVAFCPLFVAPS